jgi:hypothetical protein
LIDRMGKPKARFTATTSWNVVETMNGVSLIQSTKEGLYDKQ